MRAAAHPPVEGILGRREAPGEVLPDPRGPVPGSGSPIGRQRTRVRIAVAGEVPLAHGLAVSGCCGREGSVQLQRREIAVILPGLVDQVDQQLLDRVRRRQRRCRSLREPTRSSGQENCSQKGERGPVRPLAQVARDPLAQAPQARHRTPSVYEPHSG